jgi:hypothetical protein
MQERGEGGEDLDGPRDDGSVGGGEGGSFHDDILIMSMSRMEHPQALISTWFRHPSWIRRLSRFSQRDCCNDP